MNDTEALDYMLKSGVPLCDAIHAIMDAPSDMIPKLLGAYIKEMAEAIEPGGVHNTKLVKYLAGSTGAIVGLMAAGSVIGTAEE